VPFQHPRYYRLRRPELNRPAGRKTYGPRKKRQARYEAIHENIVTKEGEDAYKKIGTAFEAYLAKEAEIIEIGATTDQEQCRIAQDMAINDLTPLYEELDNATLALKNTRWKLFVKLWNGVPSSSWLF